MCERQDAFLNITKIISDINWEPAVGDPSFIGWIITVLYLSVSILSLLYGFKERHNYHRSSAEVLFWYVFAFVLLFLGLNKQLDLQALLIETGRVIAKQYGFYAKRREMQRVFIVIFTILSIIPILFMIKIIFHNLQKYLLVLSGILIVVLFVLIRAATMNHIYIFLNLYRECLGVRIIYIMELCGIVLVGAGVLRCLRIKE